MTRDKFSLLADCYDFIHELVFHKYDEPNSTINRKEKEDYDRRVDDMVKAILDVIKSWEKNNEI